MEIEEPQYSKMAIKKEDINNIKIEVNSLYHLEAPVEENQIIGNVKVQIGDKTIATLNILNSKKIEKKKIFDYFIDFLSLVP